MNEAGQYTGNFYKDFSTVERKLLENSQDMNAEALSHLVSSIARDHKKNCACCSQKLKLVENRKKVFYSLYGKTQVSRPYYYCKTCRKCSFGESQEQEDISFAQPAG